MWDNKNNLIIKKKKFVANTFNLKKKNKFNTF